MKVPTPDSTPTSSATRTPRDIGVVGGFSRLIRVLHVYTDDQVTSNLEDRSYMGAYEQWPSAQFVFGEGWQCLSAGVGARNRVAEALCGFLIGNYDRRILGRAVFAGLELGPDDMHGEPTMVDVSCPRVVWDALVTLYSTMGHA